MSRVSVLIISLNAEKFLVETLQSINLQEHQDIEVILVDGGSKDSTVKIFVDFNFRKGISKKHLVNENEVNIVEAYNIAGNLASGQYIYQLCADDLLCDKQWLRLSVEELDRNDDVDAVWGRAMIMHNATKPLRIFPNLNFIEFENGINFLPQWIKYSISPPDSTIVIRKEIFIDIFPSYQSKDVCDIYSPHQMFDYRFVLSGLNYFFIDRVAQITRQIDDRRSVRYLNDNLRCEKIIKRKKLALVMGILCKGEFGSSKQRQHIVSYGFRIRVLSAYFVSLLVPDFIYEHSLPFILHKFKNKIRFSLR